MRLDRYTILKWQEGFTGLSGGILAPLAGIYEWGNATPRRRLVSLGGILAIIFLVASLAGLLKPKPPVPLHKQMVLTETDDRGDIWTMDSLKNQDIQAILTGSVNPGQPLTLEVHFYRDQGYLLMKPVIIGAAGEQYFPGILKNGQWQAPPACVLTDQNDRLLAKGQFEYG